MGTKFYNNFKQNIKIFVQSEILQKEYPSFKLCNFQRGSNTAIWEGQITPSLLSRTYSIRITYKEGNRIPTINVLSPALTKKHGRIPHIYSDTSGLCLFYTKDNYDKIWAPEKPISLIIPWISLWLIFYEIFEVTGEWTGGGIEHSGSKKAL